MLIAIQLNRGIFWTSFRINQDGFNFLPNLAECHGYLDEQRTGLKLFSSKLRVLVGNSHLSARFQRFLGALFDSIKEL